MVLLTCCKKRIWLRYQCDAPKQAVYLMAPDLDLQALGDILSSPGDTKDAADMLLRRYAQAKGILGMLCEELGKKPQCMQQPLLVPPLKPMRPSVQPKRILQDTCTQHPWFSTCPLESGVCSRLITRPRRKACQLAKAYIARIDALVGLCFQMQSLTGTKVSINPGFIDAANP